MSTSNPLTRADVERILATEHYDYDDANPKWCGDHYVPCVVRDLATTALGLYDANERLRSIALQNKDHIAGGSFTNLGNVVDKRDEAIRDLRTAEARIKELEAMTDAKLEERVCELELALKNVRMLAAMRKRRGFKEGDADHLLRFCSDVGIVANIARVGGVPDVTALSAQSAGAETQRLPERDSPRTEAIATHVDNPEKGGRLSEEDYAKCQLLSCEVCEGKCLVGHPDNVAEHFRFDTVIAQRSSDA